MTTVESRFWALLAASPTATPWLDRGPTGQAIKFALDELVAERVDAAAVEAGLEVGEFAKWRPRAKDVVLELRSAADALLEAGIDADSNAMAMAAHVSACVAALDDRLVAGLAAFAATAKPRSPVVRVRLEDERGLPIPLEGDALVPLAKFARAQLGLNGNARLAINGSTEGGWFLSAAAPR